MNILYRLVDEAFERTVQMCEEVINFAQDFNEEILFPALSFFGNFLLWSFVILLFPVWIIPYLLKKIKETKK